MAMILQVSLFLTACIANPFIVNLLLILALNYTGVVGLLLLLSLLYSLFFFIPIVLYFSLKPPLKSSKSCFICATRTSKTYTSFSTTKNIWLLFNDNPSFKFFNLFIPSLRVTIISFITLSMLLVSKILTYKDIVHEKTAWNNFIWLATLLMLLAFLNKFGFVRWCGNIFSELSNLHTLGTG